MSLLDCGVSFYLPNQVNYIEYCFSGIIFLMIFSQLCGKEFNRMHNLMGHMHLHSDSKPFKCLYCSSKFTLKGNLTRHMKVKHGVMDRGLDERRKHAVKHRRCPLQHVSHHQSSFLPPSVFRQRGPFCLPNDLLTHLSQEEPFDLSQKPPAHHLSQSDGESVPGSSCQEEDEESLYSPEVDQHDQVERERASAAQWTGNVLKGPSGDRRAFGREPATDRETTGDRAHLAQRQEMPSDSEPETSNRAGPRRSRGDDSDSEPGDRQQVLNEPQIRVRREEGEKNQSRADFMVIKAPYYEDME